MSFLGGLGGVEGWRVEGGVAAYFSRCDRSDGLLHEAPAVG